MASLVHASSDFVNALRRGLEAYDGGNNTQAYAFFDEALAIEPDNIWALLWKGATAPSAKETKPWLEQAIRIEPNNEHALAGLQWVNELLIPEVDPSAIVTDTAAKEEAPVWPDEPKMAVVAPPIEPVAPPIEPVAPPIEPVAPPIEAMEEVPAFEEVPAMEELPDVADTPQPSAGIADPEPSWLAPEEEKESSDFPDWLSGADSGAASIDESSDELPDWLKEEQSTTTPGIVAPEPVDVAPWIDESKTEDTSASSASSDLPGWLNEQTGPAPQESGSLPDWLSGDNMSDAPSGELPDWLNEGQTNEAPAVSASIDNDLPDWLKDESVAAPVVGAVDPVPVSEELPSWLEGGEENDFQAQRAKGSLAASNEVVEAYQSGLLAYEEDRLDDATIAFQRVIRLDPTHVEAHNYLGSVFYLNGRPDDAIAALRQALELDSNHTESYLNLGLVYKETGNMSEAVEMFRRYLDLAPESDSTAIYVRELIQELS